MNRGIIHSLDAPKKYARIASNQQEPTTQNAINRDSGNLSKSTPSQGAYGTGNSSCVKPVRPVGVISPRRSKGEPHPLPVMYPASEALGKPLV